MEPQRFDRPVSIRERIRTRCGLRRTGALLVTFGLFACLNGCESDGDADDDVTQSEAGAQAANDASTRDAAKPADAAQPRLDGGAKPDAGQPPQPTSDAGGADKPLTNTIVTAVGPVTGEVAQDNGKQVLIFRGVPYAQAPVGDLRWKPPVPVQPWTSARPATEWGNRCPQGESTLTSPGPMSEDCLNLNVLTPATKASEKLPVMVFFHGGGLSLGTGNSDTYCNTALPAQGVVVVTVNSRLGAFGYFSHPALAAESAEKTSGNYGTMDLIESLRWVKNNITAFGGDPGNVTIFGESGGGSKVLSCMASPLAKGLFHRAIIESGSASSLPMRTTTRANAEMAGQRVAAKLAVPEGAETAAQLRAKSWQDVHAASTAPDAMFTPNLSIDGYVLPMAINEAFAMGKQVDVPLIVGANEGEASEFRVSIPTLAASMKNVTSKAYVYNFTHLPAGWRDPGCYSFHGLELAYVFGHMPGVTAPTMIFLGSSAGCMPMKDPLIGDEDRLVAKNTMAIWKQFATTGNPSVPGLIEWPAYTAENDTYLAIGAKLEVKMGVSTSGKVPGLGDAGVPPLRDAGGPMGEGGLVGLDAGTR